MIGHGGWGGVGLILADPHLNLLGLGEKEEEEQEQENGSDGGGGGRRTEEIAKNVNIDVSIVDMNVSIVDIFVGSAASRCRPALCVGDRWKIPKSQPIIEITVWIDDSADDSAQTV